MNTAKVISIEELRKRSEARAAKSGKKGAIKGATKKPKASSPKAGSDAPEALDPEVRFEKIIEAKKRIEQDYYQGDRVGMDILKAIFGEDAPADVEPDSPSNAKTPTSGEQDDASDS